MRYARSCIAGLFFVAFALGALALGFVVFPLLEAFGGSSSATRRRMRRLVRATYRLLVRSARAAGLFRVEVSEEDRARLAALRGCVVVANHLTLVDIVVLIAHLGDSTAVAKSIAAHNPFYSRIVRAAFLVNDDPLAVLSQASDLLADGVNLIVFPEGTRTPPDAKARRLRRGAAQIALASGVPVQAVVMSYDPLVLAKGQRWYDAGGHTVACTLRLAERIEAVPSAVRNRASAAALTERIGAALFGT